MRSKPYCQSPFLSLQDVHHQLQLRPVGDQRWRGQGSNLLIDAGGVLSIDRQWLAIAMTELV